MKPSPKVIFYGLSAVVLIAAIAVTFIAVTRPKAQEHPSITASALLLETESWRSTVLQISQLPEETVQHQTPLGETVWIRRWTERAGSNPRFVLRQDVRKLNDQEAAHESFLKDDPGPSYRNDFEAVQDPGTAAATAADEAVGYCVAKGNECFIIHYHLRYDNFLVDLSVTEGTFGPAVGEQLVASLDEFIEGRIR